MNRLALFFIGALLVLSLTASIASAQIAATGAVGVYYVGTEDAVAYAIASAAPYLVLVDRPELAQVYLLNNSPLAADRLRTIGRQVQREEVGLVVFCGDLFPTDTAELRSLFGVSTFGLASGANASTHVVAGEVDPLQEEIAWSSAPEIYARTVISNPNLLLPSVTTQAGAPLVQRVRGQEQFQAFLVGSWMDDASNAAWINWPYFDYFIYRLVAEAGNAPQVLSYANYPGSPVPHGNARLLFAGGGMLALLLSVGLIFGTRRALYLRPDDSLPHLYLKRTRPSGVTSSTWDVVGFHRPLAGLLSLLGISLVLFVPYLIYQTYFLPQQLVLWPQVLKNWELVTGWLLVSGIIFDLGSGTAAVYYFADQHFYAPAKSFHYFQFYLWWQLVSGAVQLFLITGLTSYLFPQTALAHLSYYFLARALLQFPGCLRLFQFFFRASQRFDYEQFLTAWLMLGVVFIQAVTVFLLRRWGGQHSQLGEVLGSMLGLGLGLYLTEWLVFFSGMLLYKVQGYSLRNLFWPTFERTITKHMLSFGARLTLGTLAAPVGYLIQRQLLATLLPNSNAVADVWLVLLNFTFAYEILSQGFYRELMPAMTEAYAHHYETLARYYASGGVRYGIWFSLFILATLSALGDRFWLGILGELPAAATELLLPLLVWGALQWLAWSAEESLIAQGRPGLRSWIMWSGQALRLALIAFLTPQWGLAGISAAYLLGALLQGLLGWYAVRRHGLRIHLSLWQTVVAPGGAALISYNLLQLLGEFYWQPEPQPTLIFLMAALLLALPVYSWLTAFLGGWDDDGLAELRRAVWLSGLGFPMSWLLYQALSLGARFSPLHNIFAAELRSPAEEEAQALTIRQTARGE
ncbi:MAG: polysaccharide biosynthesis C-terminal domain-containing protein [Chloroflexota bacterium]|nr:polysaccharide biosynthesis C-terminal domain-containing protein [Chloroflexota bacterium]